MTEQHARSEHSFVSVVIPTHNRPQWLPRAIESALAQDHVRLEIIVVDDCSHESTEAVVQSFRDTRLTYYRHPRRVGILLNYEKGLHLARGQYVVFLSDDDVLKPSFLTNRLASFAQFAHDPSVVAVFSGYDICDENMNVIGRFEPRVTPGRPLGARELVIAALSAEFNIASSLYRRDAIVAAWDRIRDSGHAFDTALNLMLAVQNGGRGLYMSWCDLLYTKHPGQTSTSDEHFAHIEQMYTSVLKAQMSVDLSRPIRRNLAAHYVSQGRVLAARDKVSEGRRHFVNAIRISPTLLWAWTQLILSFIAPGRASPSARPGPN